MVQYCLNVRRVVCNGTSGSKLITAIAKTVKRVEVLAGFNSDEALTKRILKLSQIFNVLRSRDPYSRTIRMMSPFKKFSIIVFCRLPRSAPDSDILVELNHTTDTAKEVLRKQPAQQANGCGCTMCSCTCIR